MGDMEVEVHGIGDITDDFNATPESKKTPPRREGGAGIHEVVEDGALDLKKQVQKLESDRIADRKKITEANQRRAESEERARRATAEALNARQAADEATTGGVEAQRVALDSAIAASEAAMKAAKKSLSVAWAEGKFDDAADIQETIATTAADLAQLRAGKTALPAADTKTTVGRVEAKVAPREPTTDDERFEAAISGYSPKAQAWIREHPDTIRDPVSHALLVAAHHKAIKDGHPLESPSYFEYIETDLADQLGTDGDGYDAGDGDTEPEPPRRVQQQERRPVPQQRQQTAATRRAGSAAPVSRSGGGSNGNGTVSRVKLTAGEVAQATDGTLQWNYNDPKGRFKAGDPIGTDEMARRKLALQTSGRYDHTSA